MSDLSNLYISQSYKGLINLADSTEGITSQSNYELQDGLGVGIGVSILSGSVLVDNDISSSTLSGIGNVEQYSASVDLRLDEVEATASEHDGRVEQLELYTSSLRDAFTVSGTDVDFNGDVIISGSLTVREIHTITESASVIFSSGSNQLGDEPTDVQIFSGSVYVPNLHYLGTSSVDTNTRLNEIVADALPSSWTGSVFIPFSGSVSEQIIALQEFSSSLVLDTASFALWTGSVFNPYTQSVQNQIDSNSIDISGKLNTSSYDIDSASFDSRIDTKLDSSYFNTWTSSVYTPFSSSIVSRVDDLASFTGSYATTGSNNFFGSQSIDGDVTISGSLITSGSTTLIGNSQQTGNQQLTGSINHLGDSRQEGESQITGSLLVTGSLNVSGSSRYVGRLQGNVVQVEKTGTNSNTASLATADGHFFSLDLNGVTGSVCRIETPNVVEGLTWTLKVRQPNTDYITLEFASESFEFPRLTQPITTPINGAIDIFTFVSFDNQAYYGIITKDLTPQII